jgi:protein-tyrosine phosphatase
LTGLFNARDLGGYPTREGGMTRYKVFIRSEVPKRLTEDDLQLLKSYGIKMSVDFRGDDELRRDPSVLRDVDWIDYRRSVTFDEQVAFASQKKNEAPAEPIKFPSWAVKYVEMAEECRGWVKQTLELFASCDGAVIYNCTTGKDRTGIISALLLGLAGVADADIIADYCISEVFLRPVYEVLAKNFMEVGGSEVDIDDPVFKTEPSNMAAFLRHVHTNYGGVVPYLASCGVGSGAIDTLRCRLRCDGE